MANVTPAGSSTQPKKKRRPATTPEAREAQMISLAVDLAEKQLLDGSASSQVITHYLKLATAKERIEKEILEKQKDLITAKTEALKSTERMEALYKEAIAAFASYKGQPVPDPNGDYEVDDYDE